MFGKLKQFLINNPQASQQDVEVVKSFEHQINLIEQFDDMKKTTGWQILNKQIRDDIKERLLKKAQEDERISALIDLLSAVETKDKAKLIEDEINNILPK